MSNSITYRASKRKPCPVCGEGTKNCSATSDGLHFCRGEARDGWRRIGEDDTGFGHYRRDDEPPAQPAKTKPKPKPPTDWQALSHANARTLADYPNCLTRLGDVLGVPCAVFKAFALGLSGPPTNGALFTIPERNAAGEIIGLATRRERKGEKAEKKCITDSKRGLTIPGGWRDAFGPVLLVEGFSDTAALTAAGLCALGRASATHGAELLAELLATWPAERGIIVVGENDANGAGLDGAIEVSRKLSAKLGRKVPYTLPPEEAKDVRHWLTAEARRETPWPERGAELLRFLETNVMGTEPPREGDEWHDPVSLVVLPDVPPFPSESLSKWMREFVEALAVELQVPLDLPGILVLAVAAAGIGRKVAVSPRPGWQGEPTNLFGMVSLPPGEKKSQTFKKCLAPVLEYERELQERERPSIERAESEFKVAEMRVQHLQGKLAKAECAADRPALQEELARALEERQAVVVPAMPHLQVDDDTPEKLAQELANQNGRLLVASSEARALENISMYGEKPNFDVFLKGHAGDDMKSGRIARGRQAVTKPALTCVFTPQPHVLETLGETEALRGRGFLARWLYSLPVSCVGYRDVDPAPMSEQTEAIYAQSMKELWLSDYETDDDPPKAHNLTFCPEALGILNEFLRWIEAELRPGGILSGMAGWGNKLGGLFVRLCGVLHVAGRLSTDAPWRRNPISAATARAALTLARDYAVPHARAAFALMGEDAKVGYAKKVLKWLKGREETHADFSKRDCFNGCRGTFETVDELQPVLDLLERHYLIRSKDTERKAGPGRNPSAKYQVNPAAWLDDPPTQNPHYSQNSSGLSGNGHSADSAESARPRSHGDDEGDFPEKLFGPDLDALFN